MARQFLIPGSPFGSYINETAAREYLLPNVVYLSDTTSAAAAALAGTASGVTTVSGTLTAGIMLAASISGSSTASGSISTAITLVGTVLCVCTAGAGAAGGTSGGTLTVGSTGNTDTQTKFPLPPPVTHLGMNDPSWRDWFFKINNRVQKPGQIDWTQLSFLNSNLTDIQTRRHNDLQQIQGGAAGDEYHITQSTYSDLTVVTSKTANYSVTLTDGTLLCDSSGGAITITVLPAVPSNTGKTLNIKKIDSTMNAVNITCSSLIDGVTTWTIIDSQTSMQLKSDGTTWRII